MKARLSPKRMTDPKLNPSTGNFTEKPIILCVDDEDIILISLKNHLKKNLKDDFQIEIAQSAEMGIEIIEECIAEDIHIPVIISDQIMPGMKGDEFLIKAHQLIPKTKKIMLTGQANAEAVGNALNNASLYRFLSKPWHPEDLNLTVQEAIRSYYLDRNLEEKRKDLEKALYFNHFTGHPNMSSLENALKEIHQPTCLLLIKIENYPETTKNFGILIYNKLLNTLLSKLSDEIEETIYHLYDDEIAILTQKSQDDILELYEKIKKKFKNDQTVVEETLFQIDTTISAAIDSNGEQLYSKAKIALMIASSSNNKETDILLFDNKMNESDRYHSNLTWGKKLKEAIASNKILPYFQGIQDNRIGKITKFECLARLEENGIIHPPQSFIELAKTTGIIRIITRIIIEKALQTFENLPYSFSINLTEFELEDKKFPKIMEAYLSEYKVPADRITFEILEHVNITSNSQSMKTIQALKNMNFKISLDDFGVLNSNLSRILEMEPDYIKIDGKFIRDIIQNRTAYLLTKSIKELSGSIGAETVAEFVSNKEIQEKVSELNIEYSQGYFIMEPSKKLPE